MTIHESYKKWLNNGKPKVICSCGCDQEIIIKPYHRWRGIPKYINHHSLGNRRNYKGKNNPFYGKYHTEETKQKMKNNHANFSGDKNPNYNNHMSEKSKQKISNLNSNPSKETRQKMRECKIGKYDGKNNPRYGKVPPTKRYYYNSPLHGKICFRSSWELKYAKYLDSHNILWYYEIETFELSNEMTYTPDFFLIKENKFIEIKGFMRHKDQEKINKFLEQYLWDLEILRKDDLIKLGVKI